MTTIAQDRLSSLEICVPELNEQKAIADHLDQVALRLETLSAKVESAIERLKEYRAALIAAAVTGKVDVRAA